ncbi:MAG TPA: TatA/E family twin arginine-targeting protein translocase, partial [Anaerolineae bacterium]|nr:TatA/E family twin arginine-targeting protein translocase [Anaerolineae bacterium]
MEVFGIGLPELLLIMVIALIVFGPGKLPELGAALGRAVGDFRRASRELTGDLQGTISEARTEIQQARGEIEAAAAAASPPLPSRRLMNFL